MTSVQGLLPGENVDAETPIVEVDRRDKNCNAISALMVLPERLELSTSSLPMRCSTAELRQHKPCEVSQQSAVVVPQAFQQSKRVLDLNPKNVQKSSSADRRSFQH